jgi:hypothetical protein
MSAFPLVEQVSGEGVHAFNISINDLCSKWHQTNSLTFANDLKILAYHVIKSTEDCKRDIYCMRQNSVVLKNNMIYFTVKGRVSILISSYIMFKFFELTVQTLGWPQ